ncbi:Bug family tripartite tricarboxylate transporter substrate binding protein [Imbroritus primus]|uniref:Bug family tripartite tricarboxylate transporter substrate binding protein n=1 Tax=Imbroritus primus TaxID=3058603 RepID=UPI003D160F50
METKLKMGLSHIPYRGGSPAVADVLAGHVDTSFSSAPLVVQYVRDKRLTGLAVTSTKRMAALPDIPTMNEALGTKDFEVLNWYGLFAPKGTPAAILDQINRDATAILHLPEVRARITEAGADPVGNSRDEFSAFWKAEISKYAAIIKESGAKVD